MKKYLIVLCSSLLLFSYSSCNIFKSSNIQKSQKPYWFTSTYPKEKVRNTIKEILEEAMYTIQKNEEMKDEIVTQKIIFRKDDIENFQKLQEIAIVPKSPLSEYFEANYYLIFSVFDENGKTKATVENKIQALERGKYNKWIDLKSNGTKEKEILKLIMKKLKEE